MTIRNGCVELPDMPYEDGQITIFLYTKGKYAPSQELSDMLKYIENSREENVSNPSLQRMSDMVRETKRDRTVGAKFMMWWDYEADMKRHAREEGLEEGRKEGRGRSERRAEGRPEGRPERGSTRRNRHPDRHIPRGRENPGRNRCQNSGQVRPVGRGGGTLYGSVLDKMTSAAKHPRMPSPK